MLGYPPVSLKIAPRFAPRPGASPEPWRATHVSSGLDKHGPGDNLGPRVPYPTTPQMNRRGVDHLRGGTGGPIRTTYAEQAQSLLTRTSRAVLAFAALCLLLDMAGLIVQRARISAHPLTAAVELTLALLLLAALVIWQRRWAWWVCVVTAAAWFVSPAWGDRFHPLDDLLEAALLALLLTPSMRRHVGGTLAGAGPDRTRAGGR